MLKVNNLKVNSNEKCILGGISFSMKDGEILGLVGESGSGKTITSLSIAGLLSNNLAMEGDVFLDNVELTKLSSRERREYNGSKIAFIFQEPMTSLNPLMKVGKQIEEVLKLHTDLDKKERYEKVLKIMEEVKLKNPQDLYEKYPYELSGGMRQRIVIAIASVLQPSLIIADEPTTALDATTGRTILELIKELNKKFGSKILLISHDLNVIKQICENVIVMKNGYIVETGTTNEIFTKPKQEYTKLLVEAVTKIEKENKVKGEKAIIAVENLSLYYKEKKETKIIAQNINFKMYEGEILGLLGESGCGKSTLSRAITGLNTNYTGAIHKKCQNIQMVFQDPYASLNPSKNIGFILGEPLRYATYLDENQKECKYSKEQIEKRVYETLNEIGLPKEYYNRFPDELSGGQRQRISIGTAIIARPEIIVADEPVSALDVTVQKQILDLLLELQQTHRITMLMISHDETVLNKVCDRIITWSQICEEGNNT